MPKAVFVVYTQPSSPEREAEYNEWYDTVHLPEVCAVPGINSARRFRLSDVQQYDETGRSTYMALYEIDADDIQSVFDELGRRVGAGVVHMSDALDRPPLGTAVYEVTAEYPPA
jgi:hypothetical protein